MAVAKSANFSEVLRLLGIDRHGSSHERIRRIIEEADIDFSHFKFRKKLRPLGDVERDRKRNQRRRYYKLRDDLCWSIISDSKGSDRKKGLNNDLDLEFVRELVQQGCAYCGVMNGIRMTLDRVDNSSGHTKSNVKPACIRCNITRRDMPFKAWLVVADGMRKARELGLFGEWEGAFKPSRDRRLRDKTPI